MSHIDTKIQHNPYIVNVFNTGAYCEVRRLFYDANERHKPAGNGEPQINDNFASEQGQDWQDYDLVKWHYYNVNGTEVRVIDRNFVNGEKMYTVQNNTGEWDINEYGIMQGSVRKKKKEIEEQ